MIGRHEIIQFIGQPVDFCGQIPGNEQAVARHIDPVQLSAEILVIGLFVADNLHPEMMDVPVGRTSANAITGTLLLLAGGTAEQVERATLILMAMGSELINAGGPGMGIRVKLINNYMSIALNALSAEAAVLCEALNLPFDVAVKVMSGTAAGKGHFTTSWPNKVLSGDLSPAFMIDLAHKDLGIALDVANQLHVPMPLGAASREVYSQARAAGRGRQDWSAILEQVRVSAGMTAKVKM